MIRRYRATPLHLLGHIAAFSVAAFALAQILRAGTVVNFAAWFGGAALLHDLFFLPLYSLLDRLAGHGVRVQPRVTNYLRTPALISALLLLVYFPEILGLSDRTFFSATGHHLHGYARNWLLITAGLFTASALIYAWRLRRHPNR